MREVVALERLLFEESCCLKEAEVGVAAKGKAKPVGKAEAIKSWSYTGSWRFLKIPL